MYARAARLAEGLYAEVAGWRSFDRWTVGMQLVRAADSIGANIAEAYGRYSVKDQRRLLYVARASACETEHWLDCATSRGLALPADAIGDAKHLSRMLNGLITAHRAQQLRTEN